MKAVYIEERGDEEYRGENREENMKKKRRERKACGNKKEVSKDEKVNT